MVFSVVIREKMQGSQKPMAYLAASQQSRVSPKTGKARLLLLLLTMSAGAGQCDLHCLAAFRTAAPSHWQVERWEMCAPTPASEQV